jgi:hypothetical protein
MDYLSFDLFNEIIFSNIGEDNSSNNNSTSDSDSEKEKEKEKEKENYNNEIYKNSLMLKFISAVAFIC